MKKAKKAKAKEIVTDVQATERVKVVIMYPGKVNHAMDRVLENDRTAPHVGEIVPPHNADSIGAWGGQEFVPAYPAALSCFAASERLWIMPYMIEVAMWRACLADRARIAELEEWLNDLTGQMEAIGYSPEHRCSPAELSLILGIASGGLIHEIASGIQTLLYDMAERDDCTDAWKLGVIVKLTPNDKMERSAKVEVEVKASTPSSGCADTICYDRQGNAISKSDHIEQCKLMMSGKKPERAA